MICISCAVSRRENCPACASLAPTPAYRKIERMTRELIREYRATDPEAIESERKAAIHRLKEERFHAKRQARRAAWKRHDRVQSYGKPCPISQCVCKEGK